MTTREPMTKIVRPLRSGQITIPIEFRRQLGFDDDTLLQVTLDQGELRVKPVKIKEEGSPWFRELYELFAPVRQEATEKGYTDEQINAWIDEAIEQVRRNR